MAQLRDGAEALLQHTAEQTIIPVPGGDGGPVDQHDVVMGGKLPAPLEGHVARGEEFGTGTEGVGRLPGMKRIAIGRDPPSDRSDPQRACLIFCGTVHLRMERPQVLGEVCRGGGKRDDRVQPLRINRQNIR